MPRKKQTTAPGQRQLRVGEEIRHALTRIIARDELDDPDLYGKSATITEVRISPDLRNATAFVVPFGAALTDGEAVKPLVKALNRAGAYFRGQLAREVKLQFTPSINFKADESFGQASRIEKLLHDPAVARDLGPRDDEDDKDSADKDLG
jgi:ribosome-binding factor A